MTARQKRKLEFRELFITKAESFLGYTANGDGTNIFGERLGYNGRGLPWDGAFIDVCARAAGLRWSSYVYTPQGLSVAIKEARCYNKPQRGDIVFFETSTVSTFGAPHVGIVTDVSKYLTDGVFTTIEAQVRSGQPKGSDLDNGVHQRMRSKMEVLAFVRPIYDVTDKSQLKDVSGRVPIINPAQLRPNLRSAKVATLQMALAVATGVRGLPQGHFDVRTRDAYAKFQRDIGMVPADGLPEINSLKRLATETRLFSVEKD